MGGPTEVFNGMSASGLPPLVWHKSGRSGPQGNCVELAELPDGAGVAVRNSRYPDGPVLIHSREEIVSFLRAIKEGDLDGLL